MKTYCVAILDYHDKEQKIHIEVVKGNSIEEALRFSKACSDIKFSLLVYKNMLKTLANKNIMAAVLEVPTCMD